ncbi:MAG: CAP domain-containing protein [Hyphomicrobiales bacterium]
MAAICQKLYIVAVFAVLLVALPPASRAETYSKFAAELLQNPPAGARFRPDLEAVIAGLANRYRAGEGKAPLTPDPLFRDAARAHAADMMVNGFLGHQASTGHNFDSRMRVFAGDVTRFPAMAENAARATGKGSAGAAKARGLFQQWIESAAHRRTLLKRDYHYVASGVVERDGQLWAVQIFWAKPRKKGMFQ